MVGIISHVSELKQRIPLILEVNTNQYQSYTKFKWSNKNIGILIFQCFLIYLFVLKDLEFL